MYYIMDEQGRIKPATLMEYAEFTKDESNRRVDRTVLPDGTSISTVFLGLDHGYSLFDENNHEPVLFETMIFGGKYDDRQWRYCTLEEAQVGHNMIVACLKADIDPNIQEKVGDITESQEMYTGD